MAKFPWLRKLKASPSPPDPNLPTGNATTTTQAGPLVQAAAQQAISEAMTTISIYLDHLQEPNSAGPPAPSLPRIIYADMRMLHDDQIFKLKGLKVSNEEIDAIVGDDLPIIQMRAAGERVQSSVSKTYDKLHELVMLFPVDQLEEGERVVDAATLKKMLLKLRTVTQRMAQAAVLYDEYKTMVVEDERLKVKQRRVKAKEKAAKHARNMETLKGVNDLVVGTLNAGAAITKPL